MIIAVEDTTFLREFAVPQFAFEQWPAERGLNKTADKVLSSLNNIIRQIVRLSAVGVSCS